MIHICRNPQSAITEQAIGLAPSTQGPSRRSTNQEKLEGLRMIIKYKKLLVEVVIEKYEEIINA